MSVLSEMEMGPGFPPFVAFQENFGFVPRLFRAQTLLPRVIEIEARIAAAVLLKEVALTRIQKECILLAVAAANRNTYCVSAHAHMLRRLGLPELQLRRILDDHHRAGLSEADRVLLDFCLTLSQEPTRVGGRHIDFLRRHGWADEAILEAVLVTGLTRFLCTLSTGLLTEPDFEPWELPRAAAVLQREAFLAPAVPPDAHAHESAGPYLRATEMDVRSFPPFAFFKEKFGFVPNIFRAQTLRPDVVEAEAAAVGTILLTGDVLTREQKEFILLVISAANLNTYCVAVHCEMLRNLGIPDDRTDQIALDHHLAGLPPADTALLDFALKLGTRPAAYGPRDIDSLRRGGFSEAQILEAVVMTALTNFLNTLQMGLGTVLDFPPRLTFGPGKMDPFYASDGLIGEGGTAAPGTRRGEDEDASLVRRVREGDVNAYEPLVRRHEQRVYRVLVGITGSVEDAEDCAQNAFLKAFRHIGDFQGESRFSTWLTRIAINEGLERRRGRRDTESLDDAGPESEESFRPRQVQAWGDDPETLHSKAQIRELVEKAVMSLPERYRLAVLLRDMEQLSTGEAAAALGLGVPTLKTRLLRGRLMLREALAPHFMNKGKGTARV